MAFYGCGGNSKYEDGNDIYYPVAMPTTEDKLYQETYINDIGVAIGFHLKVSEMPEAINKLHSSGIIGIKVTPHYSEYEVWEANL